MQPDPGTHLCGDEALRRGKKRRGLPCPHPGTLGSETAGGTERSLGGASRDGSNRLRPEIYPPLPRPPPTKPHPDFRPTEMVTLKMHCFKLTGLGTLFHRCDIVIYKTPAGSWSTSGLSRPCHVNEVVFGKPLRMGASCQGNEPHDMGSETSSPTPSLRRGARAGG